MSNTITTKKIGIARPDFAIASIIRGIKFRIVWFREMMRNALEATEKYYKENPNLTIPIRIKVRAKQLLGLFADYTAPKLSVLNLGGMTRFELVQAIQLFCEVDKVQDFLRNFGIGMKVTLCRFSDVLIITYKNGSAHYLVIGLDDTGGLVILKDIEEITDWAHDNSEHRGYDMQHNWTEVILLGKGPNKLTQNTLTHTFDADQGIAKIHVLKSMFERFVDMPKAIDVVFEAGTSGDTTPHNGGVKSGNVIFKTKEVLWDNGMGEYPNCKARKETIIHKDTGIKVTLTYDAPIDPTNGNTEVMSSYSENRQATSSDFVSLIWGDAGMRERYDIIDAKRWKRLASDLGIYNDYQHFKIDVELPYNEYEPSQDRSKLQKRTFRYTDEDPQVSFKDFVEIIKEVMQYPEAEWFFKFVQEHNAKAQPVDRDDLIRKWLQEYFKDMKLLKDYMKQQKKENSGNNKNNGTLDIDFSTEVLKCPKCRANGVTTAMPKGQKTCTVCGYERKHIQNNKPKSAEEILNETPLPEFRDAPHLAEYFASYTHNSAGRDTLQTNPTHKSIDKLLACSLEGELQKLDSENKDKLRMEAYKLLQVQAGVTTVIAQARQQFDEWFSAQTFDSITSDEHYTFESYQSQGLVEHVKKKGKELLKLQELYSKTNKNVLTNKTTVNLKTETVPEPVLS